MEKQTACSDWPVGHVGYVALLGRPNTGKSTFVNTVLNYHLSAVSSQPQTTRRNCLAVHTDGNAQLIFVDVPGVHVPSHELDESMARSVARALDDADLVLCLLDPTRPPGQEDELVTEAAARVSCPVFVALNKTDVATAEALAASEAFARNALPGAPVYQITATEAGSLRQLLADLVEALPEGPFLYPVDALTETPEREVAEELIREALLEQLREEVPHAIAVTVDSWREKTGHWDIRATLHVERNGQKAIVIGRNGEMLNRIRAAAVTKLREICPGRVLLKLWVKVAPEWRRNRERLKEFRLLAPPGENT